MRIPLLQVKPDIISVNVEIQPRRFNGQLANWMKPAEKRAAAFFGAAA
jgi:hypothetical protein